MRQTGDARRRPVCHPALVGSSALRVCRRQLWRTSTGNSDLGHGPINGNRVILTIRLHI